MLDSTLLLVSAIVGLAQAVVGLIAVVIVTRRSIARQWPEPDTECVLGVILPVSSEARSPVGTALIVRVPRHDLSQGEEPCA